MKPEENFARVESEAGIIATLVRHPEFSFHFENLLPNHFTNKENRYLYAAITDLARRGITTIDAYNIMESLGSNDATRGILEELTVDQLEGFLDVSDAIARDTLEEYKMLVDSVIDAAFRRDTYQQLKECQAICVRNNETNISQKIYEILDDVMMEFSTTGEVPQYKDVVDEYWADIKARQGAGYPGIPFKFPSLNEYVTIEPGELVIFGAEQKQGKSMLLLNCAVDLLKRDKAVLYLDSELNSKRFTSRLLSRLSGIAYRDLTSGRYSEEDGARIESALAWLKTRKFTHVYVPMFDEQTIYAIVKKVKHTQGLDVLIVDYLKGSAEGDAFDSYQELGHFTDMLKNKIAGDMNIAALGAAQANAAGRLADSAKIARNASTIIMLTDKKPEEIEADGVECGNKKLRVVFNRNGAQMAPDEYIDLFFDGNHITYKEAKQHIPQTPY